MNTHAIEIAISRTLHGLHFLVALMCLKEEV